LTQCLFDTVAV